MIKERKAPKYWTTWEDFANCYDLVLFNNCTDLVHRDNKSYDEGVLYEWLESHTCEPDEDEDLEEHECACEPFQWYAIAVSEYDVEFLNKNFNLDIFFSDVLGIYILPVYHYGTAWSHVSLSMNMNNDSE